MMGIGRGGVRGSGSVKRLTVIRLEVRRLIRRCNSDMTTDAPARFSHVDVGKLKLAASRMPEIKAVESQRSGMRYLSDCHEPDVLINELPGSFVLILTNLY